MHSSNALRNYKQQKQEEQEEQEEQQEEAEEEQEQAEEEQEQAEEEQEKSLLQLLLIQNLGHSAVENGRGGKLKELQVKLTE